jgi:hypothetical protein
MAKLKNYEIEALYNTICKKIGALKDERIAELKKDIKLNKIDKQFLATLAEYNALKERMDELSNLGCNLYKEIFKTGVGYSWQHTTEDGFLKHKATELLPEKLKEFDMNQYPYNTTIKDRIILANIDGNVEELIENIIAEYND